MEFFISNAYAQGAGAAGPSGLVTFLPLVLMMVVLYFIMIRPQQRRVKEHAAMIGALKKGDEVVTTGGLGGSITAINDAFLTLRIAENVEVSIQKQSIAALLPKGTLKKQ